VVLSQNGLVASRRSAAARPWSDRSSGRCRRRSALR
jgi:hypothetical protein